MALKPYVVRLNGEKIDTVFFANGIPPEEVKDSLIRFDNYDPRITVTKGGKRERKSANNERNRKKI